MSLPKLLALVSLLLFGIIGLVALFKERSPPLTVTTSLHVPLEVELDQEIQTITPSVASPKPMKPVGKVRVASTIPLPDADRVEELFNKTGTQLPIVETITYKSHVSWLKGRPAWLSDYASHYNTSRHFIARSLNGKPDYVKQELAEGDRFNVLRKDKNFDFYLVVDTSRCRLWCYYRDLDTKEKVLLKTYPVCLGRVDTSKTSGLLTPLGTYTLGNRIAIYKPKMMGTYHGKKTEMMTIFGTRWIPFEKEVENCTESAKGFGIHGTPWNYQTSGELADQTSSIGNYESDGCIRMATPDIEELFAIIITKPTTIEIVRDFTESNLVTLDP